MSHKFRYYLYAGNPHFRKLADSGIPSMIVLTDSRKGGYEKRDQLLLFKAGLSPKRTGGPYGLYRIN
jgi:hypothetical protein